jgi:hypothetical protein
MFVELTEGEQLLARHLAERRTSSAREAGQVNVRQSAMPQEVVELEGVGAELAFCKLANVYPDTGNVPRPEDCHLRDGRRIDVKATRHEHGWLTAVRWKKPGAVHLYVLMVGEFPRYRCAGFFPSSELLQDGRLKEFGSNLSYAASQDELQRLEGLLGD